MAGVFIGLSAIKYIAKYTASASNTFQYNHRAIG